MTNINNKRYNCKKRKIDFQNSCINSQEKNNLYNSLRVDSALETFESCHQCLEA